MKRILSIVLCAILLLGVLPIEAQAAQATFEASPKHRSTATLNNAKKSSSPRFVSSFTISVNKTYSYVGETLLWEVFNVIGDGGYQYNFELWYEGDLLYYTNFQSYSTFSLKTKLPGWYNVWVDIKDWTGDTFGGWAIETYVDLRTPKITSVTAVSGTSLKISWNKVAGAKGYEVYRSTSKYGFYTYLRDVTTNFYTNSYLKAGTRYYYVIRAFTGHDLDTYYPYYDLSGFSFSVAGVPLSKATIKSVVSAGSRKLKVTWGKVTGASGYRILRSTTPGGVYKQITTTTNLTYTNAGLIKGKTYFYKIQPYKRISTTSYSGPIGGYRSAKVK